MQVAEAVVLRVVDYDGVDIGHVDAALHDCGCQQHVVVVVGEVDYALLKLFWLHLPMAGDYACVGNHAVYHVFERGELLNAVVDEKHLSVARKLKIDGLAHNVVGELHHRGEYGVAVGRRSGYCAQVARAHERELQCARNWGG